jgi:mannose-6-phosphate isomerase
MDVAPYPLTFEPILMGKVWGGRHLERFGKQLPPEIRIGESWEVADLPVTSPSGAGGGAARSIIANGPLAGRSLHDALGMWREELVGVHWGAAPDFPLLVKLLDASEHLSVQVHPTADYVASHPGAFVKTESWVVLHAEPGAMLYKGLRPGADRSDLAAAVTAGTLPEVLEAFPATPGECHHLPSGTVHALGAGIVVAEFQSPSDTTFRLYDWAVEYGRAGRSLHIDAALEAMTEHPPPPVTSLPATQAVGVLASTERYLLQMAYVAPGTTLDLDPMACSVVMPTAGRPTLVAQSVQLALGPGTTAVVPAAAPHPVLHGGDLPATVLIATLTAT